MRTLFRHVYRCLLPVLLSVLILREAGQSLESNAIVLMLVYASFLVADLLENWVKKQAVEKKQDSDRGGILDPKNIAIDISDDGPHKL